MWEPLLALQKGTDDVSHILGLVQVHIVVARDFHVLELLWRGGHAWSGTAQSNIANCKKWNYMRLILHFYWRVPELKA